MLLHLVRDKGPNSSNLPFVDSGVMHGIELLIQTDKAYNGI